MPQAISLGLVFNSYSMSIREPLYSNLILTHAIHCINWLSFITQSTTNLPSKTVVLAFREFKSYLPMPQFTHAMQIFSTFTQYVYHKV